MQRSSIAIAALLSSLIAAGCTMQVGVIGEPATEGSDAGSEYDEPEYDPDPDPEPEGEGESDPEPSPEPTPDPDPDPDPEPDPDPTPNPWPEPEPDPDPQPSNDDEVCYPGLNETGTTCFPLVEINAYTYPSGSGNYSRPIRFLDIDAVNLDTMISPNFRLGEISVRIKGKYQVVQPHAIRRLQELRDAVGHPLTINSGFRSPDYNASVGGATKSRHMYGDAFDINPGPTGRDALMAMCTSLGAGYVAKYANSGHVHCDWRNSTLDSGFFGYISALVFGHDEHQPWSIYDVRAEMHVYDGVYYVEASGYDETEGELARDWVALDADGNILAEEEAMTFVAPPGTHTVRVDVGGLIEVEQELSLEADDTARMAR